MKTIAILLSCVTLFAQSNALQLGAHSGTVLWTQQSPGVWQVQTPDGNLLNITGSTSSGLQEALKGDIEAPDKAIARIMAVTGEDVRKLAGEVFTEAGLYLALVGRAKEADIAGLLRFGVLR